MVTYCENCKAYRKLGDSGAYSILIEVCLVCYQVPREYPSKLYWATDSPDKAGWHNCLKTIKK